MAEREGFLVVGAESRLGQAITERLAAEGVDVVGTSRRPGAAWPLDLAAAPGTWRLPAGGVAFLCAGIAAQDACAAEPEATRAINVASLLAVAEQLRDAGTRVIYPSTNLVLGGDRPWPPPEAPCAPQTEYARQKAAVECQLTAAGGAAVLRVGKVAESISVLDRWRAELAAGGTVAPFSDAVLSPVAMRDAAAAMIALARTGADGIHHYSAARDITYADVAAELARHVGRGRVTPTTVAESGWTGEPLPAHTCLDCSGFTAVTGIAPPDPLDVVRHEIGRRFPGGATSTTR